MLVFKFLKLVLVSFSFLNVLVSDLCVVNLCSGYLSGGKSC